MRAIYLQDKPVIRYYREVLFQRMAKRAIESAELMFKRSGNPRQQEARIFVENRKLKEQVEALQLAVKEAKSAEEAVTSEFRKKEEVLELKLQTIQHKAYSLGQSSQQLKHHQR